MTNKLDDRVLGNPGSLIRRAQQINVSLYLEECAVFDTTPMQYAVLCRVMDRDGIDQTSMARTVGIDRTTTARVVGALEKRRLLRRHPDPDDRKRNRLHVTEAGAALVDAMSPSVHRARERVLAPLEAEEREVFLRLLAKVVEGNNAFSRAPVSDASAAPGDDDRRRPAA